MVGPSQSLISVVIVTERDLTRDIEAKVDSDVFLKPVHYISMAVQGGLVFQELPFSCCVSRAPYGDRGKAIDCSRHTLFKILFITGLDMCS